MHTVIYYVSAHLKVNCCAQKSENNTLTDSARLAVRFNLFV